MVAELKDATEANDALIASIDKLVQGRNIADLAVAYQVLRATIKASEDGVAGLDDEMRATFEEAIVRVQALIRELEPLEREHLINLRVETKKVVADVKKGGEDAAESFTDAMAKVSLRGAENAVGEFWDFAGGAFDSGATRAEERIASMVNEMIKQMARLAAARFFSLLFNPVAAVGALFTPFTDPTGLIRKAGQGGGLPLGASQNPDGSSVRQFIGAVVRPLDAALQSINLQAALLAASTPIIPEASRNVVPLVEDEARRINQTVTINALDAMTFERYMRDGPGSRAVIALAEQGRFVT